MRFGPAAISPTVANRPTVIPAMAPTVLNRRQKIENTSTGKFAEAATAIPKVARIKTFDAGPIAIAIRIAIAPTARAADPCYLHTLAGFSFHPAMNYIRPETV